MTDDHNFSLPNSLSDLTLDAVKAESMRAHLKHSDKSMLSPNVPDIERLAALTEELGEVAELFTYDKRLLAGDKWKDMLVKELIQVGNVALSWAQAIDGEVEAPRCASCNQILDDPMLSRTLRSIDKDLVWCNDVCYRNWQSGIPIKYPPAKDLPKTHSFRILDQSDEV